jgi:hypothetical protein
MSESSANNSILSEESSRRPATIAEMDDRSNSEWAVSFAAAMVPFTAFCYGHSRGMTGKVVEAVVKSPVGVYGLLALPFITLAMEKSIYDTVQAAQGINPNIRPADRGGFPSGGAELPSFSLVPVQKRSSSSLVPPPSSLLRKVTIRATNLNHLSSNGER